MVVEKPGPVEGSYMPCFRKGVSAAEAFALAWGIPLVHDPSAGPACGGNVFAAKGEELFREHLFFHISGGTTDPFLAMK